MGTEHIGIRLLREATEQSQVNGDALRVTHSAPADVSEASEQCRRRRWQRRGTMPGFAGAATLWGAGTQQLTVRPLGQARPGLPHPARRPAPRHRREMICRPRKARAVVSVAALCLLVTVTSCSNGGGSKTSSGTPSSSASAPSSTSARITIKGFAFKPSDLTVAAGSKVTVTNQDSVAHTVTATGKKAFDTGTIAAGKTVTFTAPSTSGKYPYICTIHQYMKGSLTVR